METQQATGDHDICRLQFWFKQSKGDAHCWEGPPTAGVQKLPVSDFIGGPNDDLWSMLKQLVTRGAAERGAAVRFISNQASGAAVRSPTHRRMMSLSQ